MTNNTTVNRAATTTPIDEPDWEEVARQAEEVTGLKVEPNTFSIIIREVREWLAQRGMQDGEDPVAVDEREAFEAWAMGPDGRGLSAEKFPNGNYKSEAMHDDWRAWQARAALQSARSGQADRPLSEVIEELRDAHSQSGWAKMADPIAAAAEIRSGQDGGDAGGVAPPASVEEALRFYADKNIEWVTFAKGEREAQLARLQSSDDWQRIDDDGRGHEQFVVTTAKAEAALEDLLNWQHRNRTTPQPAAVSAAPVQAGQGVGVDVARDAREALQSLLNNIRSNAPQLSGKSMGFAEQVIARIDAALAASKEGQSHE